MPRVLRLFGGQVDAPERMRGGRIQVDQPRPRIAGDVGQRARVVEREAADAGPTQRREVSPDAERGAEITGESTDVGAGRAGHLDPDVEQRVTR